MSLLKTAAKFTASALLTPFYVASKITKIAAQYTVDVAKFGVDFFLPGDSNKDLRGKIKGGIDEASGFTERNYNYFVNDNLKNSASYAPGKVLKTIDKTLKWYEKPQPSKLDSIVPDNSPHVVSAERLDPYISHGKQHP